jgi:transcriptional repressor NrdR
VKCPFCAHPEDKVVDSREGKEGRVVRRRRECLSCARRFTTYERVDEIPYMVVKKDGRRESFDRNKLLTGLVKACEKRPVPMNALEGVVDEVENMLQESPEKELPATLIGERLMERLKVLDQVAYVRFASVYRQFGDLNAFMDELNRLLGQRKS